MTSNEALITKSSAWRLSFMFIKTHKKMLSVNKILQFIVHIVFLIIFFAKVNILCYINFQ